MKEVTIVVEEAATIRGRVLDPVGKPVACAVVVAWVSTTGLFKNVSTDADGRYESMLPAGNTQPYSLVAYEKEFLGERKWADGETDPILTAPGQVIDDFDIHLTRPGAVRGRVVRPRRQSGRRAKSLRDRRRSRLDVLMLGQIGRGRTL